MKEGYIEDIFKNKSDFDSLELVDLNKDIKQGNFNENQHNEAKYFDNSERIRDNEGLYESHIIKPIIGFLNSYEGFGNLYLGISTGGPSSSKFLDIKPINENIIKNEDYLRQLIMDGAGVFPVSHYRPLLKIKKIRFEDGNVFIVSAEKANNNSVYFSKISNYIYKRNFDETNKLDLIDSIRLIESKKNPRLLLEFSYVGITKPKNLRANSNSLAARYNVYLVNNGFEPSFFVTGLIKSKPGKTSEFNPVVTLPNSWKIVSNINSIVNAQFIKGVPPDSMPIYPGIKIQLGEMTVEYNPAFNLDLNFEIKIMDKKGTTTQSFSLIESFNDKNPNLKPRDEKIEYISYI